MKKCKQCKEEFEPKKSTQIYCTTKCTKRACWERNKDRYSRDKKLRYYADHKKNKLKMQQYYLDHREDALVKRKEYYETNRDKIIEDVTEWRKKNPEKVNQYNKKYRKIHRAETRQNWNDLHTGGRWQEVMDRDKKQCRTCGAKIRILIHHIDKNHKNNELGNMMVLCRACHMDIHRNDINKSTNGRMGGIGA